MQASHKFTTDHNGSRPVPLDPGRSRPIRTKRRAQAPRHSAGTRRIAQNPAPWLVQHAASLQRFALVVTRRKQRFARWSIVPGPHMPSLLALSMLVLDWAAPTKRASWPGSPRSRRGTSRSDDVAQTRQADRLRNVFLRRIAFTLDFD